MLQFSMTWFWNQHDHYSPEWVLLIFNIHYHALINFIKYNVILRSESYRPLLRTDLKFVVKRSPRFRVVPGNFVLSDYECLVREHNVCCNLVWLGSEIIMIIIVLNEFFWSLIFTITLFIHFKNIMLFWKVKQTVLLWVLTWSLLLSGVLV